MDVPVVGMVLGSAEQDVACLPHQKIGVHHQIGQFGQRMFRLRHPKVGIDLLHCVLSSLRRLCKPIDDIPS
jgi:hypothetical protein